MSFTSNAAIAAGNYEGRTLDHLFAEDTTYTVEYTTDIGGILPVPEPTVLALLALGVAGVSLRRKVAA